ncbi:hypothetical protein Tco_1219774 [Tanacetum coccineum]
MECRYPSSRIVTVISHPDSGSQCHSPFGALYGQKCNHLSAGQMLGMFNSRTRRVIHETTEKIIQIQQRLQATRDRQRSYANVRRKPLEFQVGDRVMLKVSPPKGVIRFEKRGKFNLRNYQEESFTHKEEMAPMDLSDSDVKTCSKTCLKNHETLKKQYDDLRTEFNKSEFNLANYKRGLTSVEGRLVFYKKNEVMFCEQIVVLKRDITYKDSNISVLICELEKLKKEKESNKLKLNKFENASKSLDKLTRSQISDNSRKGVGFPEFEGYGPKTSKSVSEVEHKKVRKNDGAPIIKDWVSDDEEQEESKPMFEKKTVIPAIKKIEFVRPKQQEKPVRKLVKYAEMYRSQKPRENQTNWNNQKSQQLGNDFVIHNKACYVCGSFDHLQYTCKQKKQLNGQREKKPGNPEIELEDSVRLNSPEDKKETRARKTWL